MAEAKKKAPAVKKAAPKKATKTTPLSDKSLEDLNNDLATKRDDLLTALRSHKAGELVNPRVLRETRKEIARLHTAISAKERATEEGK